MVPAIVAKVFVAYVNGTYVEEADAEVRYVAAAEVVERYAPRELMVAKVLVAYVNDG